MKFALVVASGVRAGTVIPAPGPKLIVGRGEGCHLRPASPAISNKHCEFVLRDGVVYLRDLGSTNGTVVNDVTITDEIGLAEGDRIKVGPLDFTLKLTGQKSDSTPLPEQLKSVGTKSSPNVPKPAPKPTPKASSVEDDAMAAMLLGMDDDDPVEVPGGSTVMELPAVDAEQIAKAMADKKVLTQADSSSAARDLLTQYTQRPRTPPRK